MANATPKRKEPKYALLADCPALSVVLTKLPAIFTLMIPNIQRAKKINKTPSPKFIQGSVAIRLPRFAYLDWVATSLTPHERKPTTKPIKTKVPAIPSP